MWWLAGEPIWHSKLRYSIQYGVRYSSVTKLKEPHKCDFLTAPIGNKNCHYEAEVSTVRTAISTEGKPIVSWDDGKTWTSDDNVPLTKSSVSVSWKKVDEDED
jgi:hypothetical protein